MSEDNKQSKYQGELKQRTTKLCYELNMDPQQAQEIVAFVKVDFPRNRGHFGGYH